MNEQPAGSPQPQAENAAPTIGSSVVYQPTQDLPNSLPNKPPSSKFKYVLIALFIIIVLAAAGFVGYKKLATKTSYQDVVKQFITAMRHKDQTTVGKLESPDTQAVLQRYDGSSNLYVVCSKIGSSCIGIYNSTFFDTATISISNYNVVPGGKNVQYSSTSGGCKTLMTFQLIPHDNSWLIDHINENYTSPIKTCSTSISSSTSTHPAVDPYANIYTASGLLEPSKYGLNPCKSVGIDFTSPANTLFSNVAVSNTSICANVQPILSKAVNGTDGTKISAAGFSCTADKDGAGYDTSLWQFKGQTFYSYNCSNSTNQIAFNWEDAQ